MTTITVESGYLATDLELARIGLDNALENTTTFQCLRQSNDNDCDDADYPIINMTTRNTYQTARPTAGDPKFVATWSTPVTVNYIGIARHNLSDVTGNDGYLYVTPTGGSSELVASFESVSDNSPILIPFASTEIEAAEIHIGNNAHGFKIAVCHLGEAVVMERPLRSSMSPLWLSNETDVNTQISDAGEVLGSVLIRRGVSASPSWENLTKSFYNTTLKPLARDMVTKPFFFGWRPDDHPLEVMYGAATGDPEGSHSRGIPRYSFNFSMKGIGQ